MGISLKEDEIVCTENPAHFSINKHSYYVVNNTKVSGVATIAQNSNVQTFDIPIYSKFGCTYYGVFEITLKQNPNGGGSSIYSTAAQMTVETQTGWHGSGYVPTIARANVDWATYSGTFAAMIYNNGTIGISGEYPTSMNTAQSGNQSTYWSSNGIFLRLKLTNGFNSTFRGHNQIQIIAKCCGQWGMK